MINNKLLFQFLRYIVQGIIIYLLFRYLPVIKMDASYALIVTLSILLLCIAFELCFMYFRKSGSNNDLLDILNKPCKSCNLEKFDNNSTKGGKCRIVCDEEDDDNKKKNNNENKKKNNGTKNNGTKNNNAVEKKSVEPSNDDRFDRGPRYDNGFGFGGMFMMNTLFIIDLKTMMHRNLRKPMIH